MTNNKNSTLKKTFISSHQLTLPEHNNLIVIRGDYNNQLYSHGLFDLYNISCPDSIKKSVVKRQAEYLAGRYCAKEALEILASPAIEITSGQHRNPIWPFNITGSIAHTSATAYAAVGYSNDYCRIGIDYETILSPHTAKNLFFSIVSETEREHLLTWPMDFES